MYLKNDNPHNQLISIYLVIPFSTETCIRKQIRLQGNSESCKNIKHLSALKGRSCVSLYSTFHGDSIHPQTWDCLLQGLEPSNPHRGHLPAVQGRGAAMGEGSELGEVIRPNLGDFCKPHYPEEQSLTEGELSLGVCSCSGSAWESLNSKFLIREAKEQP